MDKAKIIADLSVYVKAETFGEATGHDWFHIERVVNNARKLQEKEGGDLFIIKAASLTHDLGDPKLHNGDLTASRRIVGGLLERMSVPKRETEDVLYIIDNMSFYKSFFASPDSQLEKSIEFKVVQDADWLDALGAIGITRALQYGTAKGRPIYDPNVPETPLTKERYRNTKDTITHLREKGLVLPSMLNTETAKRIVEPMNKILVDFLDQFKKECEGRHFDY